MLNSWCLKSKSVQQWAGENMSKAVIIQISCHVKLWNDWRMIHQHAELFKVGVCWQLSGGRCTDEQVHFLTTLSWCLDKEITLCNRRRLFCLLDTVLLFAKTPELMGNEDKQCKKLKVSRHLKNYESKNRIFLKPERRPCVQNKKKRKWN